MNVKIKGNFKEKKKKKKNKRKKMGFFGSRRETEQETKL